MKARAFHLLNKNFIKSQLYFFLIETKNYFDNLPDLTIFILFSLSFDYNLLSNYLEVISRFIYMNIAHSFL